MYDPIIYPTEVQEEKKVDINEILKYKVDINANIPKPEIILSICDAEGQNKRMVMTRQNISCVTAQAKVGKSFLVKLIISACLKKGFFQNRLHSEMPIGKDKILYIDTEQSLFHVQLGLKQIRDLISDESDFKKLEDNLDVFTFDTLDYEESTLFVKTLIYTEKYSLVIIDGVSDLMEDTNELKSSKKFVSTLRKWATECDLHIVNVIHLNPGELSHKMKGHAGTILTDKSEVVLGVSVDKENENNKIVQSLASRNRKSDPFMFEINENGVPNIIEDFDVYNKIQTQRRPNKTKLLKDKQTDILCEAFKDSDDSGVAYGDLLDKIKRAYIKITNDSIGDNLAKKFIQECKETSKILMNTENKKYLYVSI